MRRYDLVIFDLDGTLADTRDDIVSATNYTLTTLGLPLHEPDRIASFVGHGVNVLLGRALGPDHLRDSELLTRGAALFRSWYLEHMLDQTRPYPGMQDVLDRLESAGVGLSVATNKARMFTEGMVSTLFPHRFTPVIACTDGVPAKPDPTCVALCLERHPDVARERILFVGDSAVDIETARNAGVDALAVTWGFRPREELVAASPRWLRDDVAAIAQVVLDA